MLCNTFVAEFMVDPDPTDTTEPTSTSSATTSQYGLAKEV